MRSRWICDYAFVVREQRGDAAKHDDGREQGGGREEEEKQEIEAKQ